MLQHQVTAGFWDRLAMAVSGLCVVHCVTTAVLVGLMSSVSTLFADPLFHEIGLAVAIVLAAIGLGAGYRVHGLTRPLGFGLVGLAFMALALAMPHGLGETVLTIVGVSLLAFGHHVNRRLAA